MSARAWALCFLVGGALVWSTSGVLYKTIDWNPVVITGWRSLVSALVIYLLTSKYLTFSWSPYVVIGSLTQSVSWFLAIASFKYTTAANSIVLYYAAPVYIAILAPFLLKERTTRLDWVSVCLAIGGMSLCFMGKLSTEGMIGNLMAMGAGLAYSITLLMLRKIKDGCTFTIPFMANTITAVIALPMMIMHPGSCMMEWGGILLLGTVFGGLTHIGYSLAVKHATALETSLLPMIDPVLCPVWVALIVGEMPGTWSIVGGVVVIGAVAMRGVAGSVSKKKARRRAAMEQAEVAQQVTQPALAVSESRTLGL